MYQRILICDDIVYSRAILKNIINQIGEYIITEAENEPQLIEKLRENKKKKRTFDLIFLDLEMRRNNGIEILKQVREIEPLAEVVLCGSGISLSDKNIAKGMELGVKQFIPKPYKYKEVSMVLDRL